MTPTSRTFIFDSAENDLFDSYNDVEATFFSTTDSDSALSDSSTDTLSDSSSDSHSSREDSNDRRRQSRQGSSFHGRGNPDTTQNTSSAGNNSNKKSQRHHTQDVQQQVFHTETTERTADRKYIDNDDDLYEDPPPENKINNSGQTISPIGASGLSSSHHSTQPHNRATSFNSYYSAYSMHTISSHKTDQSAKSSKSSKSDYSSKSHRRADPLYRLKNLVRRRQNESDWSDDSEALESDSDDERPFSAPVNEHSERLSVLSEVSSSDQIEEDIEGDADDDENYDHNDYEDEDADIEIQVGNKNENGPPGIMMPFGLRQSQTQQAKISKDSSKKTNTSSQNSSGKVPDGNSQTTDQTTNAYKPVVIEEPSEPEMRRRKRKGEEQGGHRRKDGSSIRKNISHREYSTGMASASAARRRAGWDPGIDLKTTQVILESVGSTVTIVDYNATRFRVVQTEVLPEHQGSDDDSSDDKSNSDRMRTAARLRKINKDFYYHLDNRPSWSSVRWISVNGLSWEAISAISQQFQLHRLAIEDMIEIPQRTKVDNYPTHIFCVLPMHKLMYYRPEKMSKAAKENGEDNEPEAFVSKAKSLVTFAMPEWMSEGFEKGFHSIASAWHSIFPLEESDSELESSNVDGENKNKRNSVSGDGSEQKTRSVTKHKRPHRQSLAPFTSISQLGHKVNTNANKLLRLYDSDASSSSSSSDSSSDSDTDRQSVSRLLSKQKDKIIYDWSNSYTRNSQHQTPRFIEEKFPLAAYRRAVGVEQVSLFLTNKQTVISFFERSGPDIERPLLARLASESTILRESCDPSMLLQAIIDIIVDQVQPAITAYKRRFTELEVSAMTQPTMAHTQELHFMTGELSLLRNTIFPISTLVQSLRDHKDPTVAAQNSGFKKQSPLDDPNNVGQFSEMPSKSASRYSIYEGPDQMATVRDFTKVSLPAAGTVFVPFPARESISNIAKLYLGDIGDHLFTYTQDIDMMRENTQNMVEVIFNTIFYQSGDSVSNLSFLHIIFLPLTFWTNYYGMNFITFGNLDSGVKLFWKIAVPFTFGVFVIIMVLQLYDVALRTLRRWRRRWNRRQYELEKKKKKEEEKEKEKQRRLK